MSQEAAKPDRNAPRNTGFSAFICIKENPDYRILWPLFLVSFASLYLEILLIRWIGTEVRLFAYIQNLTLIACFLGFGLGCLKASEKPRQLFNFSALACLVLMIEVPWPAWKGLLDVAVGGLSASSNLSL